MDNGGIIKIKIKEMRKLFALLIMVVLLSLSVGAKDYTAPTKERSSVTYTDTITGDTYTIKDIKYDVFKTKSNARYIWKTSKKTNKKYKYYLPKEIQIQMGRKYNN